MKQLFLILSIFVYSGLFALEIRPIKSTTGINTIKLGETAFSDTMVGYGRVQFVVENTTSSLINNYFLVISSNQFCAKYKLANFDTIPAILSDLSCDIRIEDRMGNVMGKSSHLTNRLGYISNYKVSFYERIIYNNSSHMNVKKPVLYCYNKEKLDVIIDVKTKADVGFVYPNMNRYLGWECIVEDNVISVDGKSYPYLFWEGGLTAGISNVVSGYKINTDTVVSFLENSLMKVGFNSKESTDFITYWAPVLSQKQEVFITFLQNDAYSKEIAELNISPKPETLIRLFMVYDFDYKGDFERQLLRNTVRNGFTVTDWGGGELEINKEENL